MIKRLLFVLTILAITTGVHPVYAGGTGVVSCVGLPAALSHAVVIAWDWNRRNPIRSQRILSDPVALFQLMNLSGRGIWNSSVQTWERPPYDMFHLSTHEIHLIAQGYSDSDSDHYAIIKVFDNDLNWQENYVLAFQVGTPAQHPCFAAGVDKGGLYWIMDQARRSK